MSTRGILASPYQRRVIISVSLLSIAALIVCAILLTLLTPETRWWKLVYDIIVALNASAMFAFFSAALLYFFTDPREVEASTEVLPQDIGAALDAVARSDAPDYMLYVRTGRHFRANVLPRLIEKAKAFRRRIKVDIVLLDFRDEGLCKRYADYRNLTTDYVQKEIMATILMLIDASKSTAFLDIDLYLSTRLSTFRLDGTADEIIITREDRSDFASRYKRSDPFHAAFTNEFRWIKAESDHVRKISNASALPATLSDMFGYLPIIAAQLSAATDAKTEPSPYVR
jgi:phosphate/sulfate permease